MPNTLKENSFWTKANEEALADDDILKGLQSKFASKPVAKKTEVTENNNKNKKVRLHLVSCNKTYFECFMLLMIVQVHELTAR